VSHVCARALNGKRFERLTPKLLLLLPKLVDTAYCAVHDSRPAFIDPTLRLKVKVVRLSNELPGLICLQIGGLLVLAFNGSQG